MTILKGPISCRECVHSKTMVDDYEYGDVGYHTVWYECHLTERDVTDPYKNGQFHRTCPLMVNTEWPLQNFN